MAKTSILIVSLGLLAAACGSVPRDLAARPSGSTGAGPSASAATPAPSPARASQKPEPTLVDPRRGGFEIAFGEYAITTETRWIRPGRVTFEVRNGGKLAHGFEMKSESEGGSHGGHGRRRDRFEVEEPTFEPGGSFELTLTLAAGVYELECYVGNHEALGMRTILRVSDEAPLVKEAAEAGGDTVAIRGFSFGPETLSVTTGSTVTWLNGDPTEHTVTAKDGSFGSDPLAANATFSMTFDRAGAYRYYCAIHPTMEGVIRVTGVT